ncbi:MAG: NAD(+)/NADH kinase [Desulfobacteraceae bacterium]|nr:NAD(+)/NADH kinase [Desulfobacteraceae bacterium]
MEQIGLFVKRDKAARDKADELAEWFRQRGIEVVRRDSFQPKLGLDENRGREVDTSSITCVFVLGGDGTFLSASRWIGDSGMPMIGVKFGDIGFLAEISEDAVFLAAEAVISRNFTIESRDRLQVEIIRNGKPYVRETVLNDVVINKGVLARLANIDTYIDEHYLTTYRSDGLIVATPTGSTAYSLAAGGPVVHPAVEGFIVTPICPFTLTNRVLVVPNSSRIKIRPGEKSSDIVATFDGQEGMELDSSDEIIMEKSRSPLQLIKLPGYNYFDILKAKLRWSGGRI